MASAHTSPHDTQPRVLPPIGHRPAVLDGRRVVAIRTSCLDELDPGRFLTGYRPAGDPCRTYADAPA
jgi:hypothetical protein